MLFIDVHATMEGHGRGGILQNSTEDMELDLAENQSINLFCNMYMQT